MSKTVYIVGAARTPMGAFGGVLSSLSATQLGSIAIKGALQKAGIQGNILNEVFMGCVVQANLGQSPARQASLAAGIPDSVDVTTINKVCASGSKAIMFGAQAIQLGQADLILAGGMESMSNAPYYVPKARTGYRYGNGELVDGLVKDGLCDPHGNMPMGMCGEICAAEYKFTREELDQYAIESYRRALEAQKNGWYDDEIVNVEIPQRKGDPVIISKDEQPGKVNFDKIPTLAPAFKKDGVITAANASPLSDGASAVVLASEEAVKKYGLKPLAKIISYGDAAKAPEWFTTAPVDAMNVALSRSGLTAAQMDACELNEAFAVVSLYNAKAVGIPLEKVNQFGGAIALGHPLGSSGARIVVTLLNVLNKRGGKYGITGICNGGGAASSIIIERL